MRDLITRVWYSPEINTFALDCIGHTYTTFENKDLKHLEYEGKIYFKNLGGIIFFLIGDFDET